MTRRFFCQLTVIPALVESVSDPQEHPQIYFPMMQDPELKPNLTAHKHLNITWKLKNRATHAVMSASNPHTYFRLMQNSIWTSKPQLYNGGLKSWVM